MTKTTKQVQQRFPVALLAQIDEWSESNDMTRTAAVNFMCQVFFESQELERLRKEVQELRQKVINLAMGRESR